MMTSLGVLDWLLIVGILVLGTFLAVHFEKRYKVAKLDFLITTVFVACLAAMLIGVYHLLRTAFSILQ